MLATALHTYEDTPLSCRRQLPGGDDSQSLPTPAMQMLTCKEALPLPSAAPAAALRLGTIVQDSADLRFFPPRLKREGFAAFSPYKILAAQQLPFI